MKQTVCARQLQLYILQGEIQVTQMFHTDRNMGLFLFKGLVYPCQEKNIITHERCFIQMTGPCTLSVVQCESFTPGSVLKWKY